MSRRGIWTLIGAVLLASVGFALGAFGFAWRTYDSYAEPWRKMRIEHEGVHGKPSHSRLVVENPKMAVQAINLSSSADGAPTSARISLKDGQELTMTFDEKGHPASLTGPDGAVARFTYETDRTLVSIYASDGTSVGTRRLAVPIQLLASAEPGDRPSSERLAEPSKLAGLWESVASEWIGEARADESADETITVAREIPLGLDVHVTGTDSDKPGTAQLEASCAPRACVPSRREIPVPGASDASIFVTGTVKKSELKAPGDGDINPFKADARAERKAAAHDLPILARVVGGVAITAIACKTLSIASPLCVKEFRSDPGVAGGAVSALLEYEVPSDASVTDPRAKELFYEDQARATLDQDMHVEVCASRDGYARVCTTIDGRPFGTTAIDKVSRSLELHPAVGGTLVGSFTVTQSDGADCKFSPSPRTAGPFRLTFDDEHLTVSASLASDEHGTRQDLSCSLGAANMSWNQSYSISATQTFTKEQLHAGGKLPLKLAGTMTGSGGYSFSNCRAGGASGACPAGKNEGYSYPVEINGTIDLDAHTGGGQIAVTNAPLFTQGTWRIPAEAKP